MKFKINKRKKKRGAILLAIILVLQFILFPKFWVSQVGAILISQDNIQAADAILVLGGGKKERVLQGVELYNQKLANRLMFTGEYGKVMGIEDYHWAKEAKKLALELGVQEDNIILILDSKSTRDDATLSKDICTKNKFKSLIVVSEPYHTFRSRLTFKKVYRGSGIKIMVYPVQESWYKKDNWWRTEKGFLVTSNEYMKLWYYIFKGYLL